MPPSPRSAPTGAPRREPAKKRAKKSAKQPAKRPATRGAKPARSVAGAPAGPPLAAAPVPTHGRHREIIDAAAELMAERGYGGASLRELARRVGVSQPSLYHYFRTKEDLALQILETLAADMLGAAPGEPPHDPVGFPRAVADVVRVVYEGHKYPLFVRAVFAFSRMDPRFGARNREIFVDTMLGRLRAGLSPYVARGELPEAECIDLLRVVVHAVGFRLMEERVLFDDRPLGPDVERYIDFVVELAERRIRALWRPAPA